MVSTLSETAQATEGGPGFESQQIHQYSSCALFLGHRRERAETGNNHPSNASKRANNVRSNITNCNPVT